MANKKPIGVIEILNAAVLPVPDYRGHQNVFRVRVLRGASFLFEPSSAEEAQQWIRSILIAARGGLDDDGIVAIGEENGPSLFGAYVVAGARQGKGRGRERRGAGARWGKGRRKGAGARGARAGTLGGGQRS